MRVLLVEDDAVSRRLLRSYLEKWGHEVTEAEDGAAAWALFEDREFPVVVSDWMMPQMDGLDLVRRVRSRPAQGYVYVILITSKTQTADVAEGIEAGADEFVCKPVEREDLRVRLWEAERIIGLHDELARHKAEHHGAPPPGPLGGDGATAVDALRALWADVLAAIPDPEDRARLTKEFEARLAAL